MSLDKLYFLGAYDTMKPAGDSTSLFQLVFHVESPAVSLFLTNELKPNKVNYTFKMIFLIIHK